MSNRNRNQSRRGSRDDRTILDAELRTQDNHELSNNQQRVKRKAQKARLIGIIEKAGLLDRLLKVGQNILDGATKGRHLAFKLPMRLIEQFLEDEAQTSTLLDRIDAEGLFDSLRIWAFGRGVGGYRVGDVIKAHGESFKIVRFTHKYAFVKDSHDKEHIVRLLWYRKTRQDIEAQVSVWRLEQFWKTHGPKPVTQG